MEAKNHCPLSASARILGARWTLEIIYNLREARRFCEIQEAVRGINPRTLSARLKSLEEAGILRRLPVSAASPHKEYELTTMGRDLLPILDSLQVWGEKWVGRGRVDGGR